MPHPDPPPLQQAARLLAEGQPAEARAVLASLVAERPVYAAAHVLHATALEAVGEPSQALEAWHEAHFLVPSSPLVARERARLRRALAAEPEPEGWQPDPEAEPPLPAHRPPSGPVYEALGDLDEAEVAFPDDTPAPAVWPPAASPDERAGWRVVDEDEARLPSAPPPADAAVALPRPVFEPIPEGPEAGDSGPGGSSLPHVEAGPPRVSPALDELDDLIAQLAAAPRIVPDPEFEGDAVRLAGDIADDMASDTLAEIHLSQGQYVEAARMYDRLAERNPQRAADYRAKAAAARRSAV